MSPLPPPESTDLLRYPDRTDYSEPATAWFTHYAHPGRSVDPGKVFLTDIDGVLVDWLAGFEGYIRPLLAAEGRNPADRPLTYHEDIRAWITADDRDPDAIRAAQGLIEAYQVHADAARIPAFPDALEFIPRLHREFGYSFVAVSTAGGHPDIAARRIELVEHHFGLEPFHAFHILPPLTSKEVVLARYAPTVWVDDMPRQVEAGRKAHHLSFLMDRGGEHADVREIRVPSWSEVYDFLREARR